MRLLLVYPPFCPPSSMPYSISRLKTCFRDTKVMAECLDLNAKFHRLKFNSCYGLSRGDFWHMLDGFVKESKGVYAANNKKVLTGGKPELLDEMIRLIEERKPEALAFSIVYSSQVFYTAALIEGLKKRMPSLPCMTGGPAVSHRLKDISVSLEGWQGLVSCLGAGHEPSGLDYEDYDQKDYLTKDIVVPVRSSVGCPYRACAFCTHHGNAEYEELPLDFPTAENYFFIDDMIPLKRLLQIAESMGQKKASWMVQLRPTEDLIPHLPRLRDSGLKCIMWGVESGCQQVLDRMHKGTKLEAIRDVLHASRQAGIRNIVYILFNFPGETREQFMETVDFLKVNSQSIDLVSASLFGLQKGSRVWRSPEKYGISCVTSEKRKFLDEKISFMMPEGIPDARVLKARQMKKLLSLNRMPRGIAYLKEQALFWDG